MNEQGIWIWLLLGLIPYYIEWQRLDGEWMLGIRALFWSLRLHLRRKRCWRLYARIQLIERLRKAIWAAINVLREVEPRQD